LLCDRSETQEAVSSRSSTAADAAGNSQDSVAQIRYRAIVATSLQKTAERGTNRAM
jgi:hypothetical protein